MHFCQAAHASGLVSELIIAHLGIDVLAGESNGLFILSVSGYNRAIKLWAPCTYHLHDYTLLKHCTWTHGGHL